MVASVKNRVLQKIEDMSDKELMVLLEALDHPDRFTEKRKCERLSYPTSAEYVSRTVKGWGEIRDISVGGLFMYLDPARNPLYLGQDVVMRVRHPKKGKRIKLRGKIIRATSAGVGVEFVIGVKNHRDSDHPDTPLKSSIDDPPREVELP